MSVKNYGPAVSGYLDPSGRAFENIVHQAGKPVLDKELNLSADLETGITQSLTKRICPSGWLTGDFTTKLVPVTSLFQTSATPNALQLSPQIAHVNGWVISVVNTGQAGPNLLDLGVGPSGAGARRTDLVILEVWRKLISAVSADGKSPTSRIWREGNVKVASANDAALNLVDDMLDSVVNAETTKRVQIQYRLRVIKNVDLFAYPSGIADPSVVANTVPATSGPGDVDGTASAYSFSNQGASGDPGLWRAGDGVPSNGLGTVDGYMYAIPVAAVFRRNVSPFSRNLNHNGGTASTAGASTRPDGLFTDILDIRDLADLRSGVSLTGWSYTEVIEKNFHALLDNVAQNEWFQDGIGGSTDGHTLLTADELGVLPGDGTVTGDTPGANFIAQFDFTRRRFSDRVVYEVMTVKLTPGSGDISTGTWQTGTIVTVRPSALAPFPYAPFNFPAYAPSQTRILDVLGARIQGTSGGDKTYTIGQVVGTPGTSYIPIKSVTGSGVFPMGNVLVTLGTVPGGSVSTEPIYLDLLIAYPAGQGLTRTPTKDYGAASFTINNPGQLPGSGPINYSALANLEVDYAHREANIQYTTSTQTFICKADTTGPQSVYLLPERATVATATVNGTPRTVNLSADGRTATFVSPTSAGDNLIFSYTALRPIPQNSVQFTLYYESKSPQTIRNANLGTSIQLIPRHISSDLYVLTAGSGSRGEAYPFPYAYNQTGGVSIPVGGFSGEHQLNGSSSIYTANFSADTGFLKLPAYVPYTPDPQFVEFDRTSGDADIEDRTYFKTVPTNQYIPNAYAPQLADPRVHKVLLPCLMETTSDTAFAARGTLVLVVFVRWAQFDPENSIKFDMATPANNTTVASIFRTNGNLLSRKI